MIARIVYWTSTIIVSVMLFFSLSYLTGAEQVVEGFAKAGYPQHLRIVLGIAKPTAGIVLLLPGLALLKEWAYACVAFTWVMACISARSSKAAMPPLGGRLSRTPVFWLRKPPE